MDPVSAKQYGKSKHKQSQHRDKKYRPRKSSAAGTLASRAGQQDVQPKADKEKADLPDSESEVPSDADSKQRGPRLDFEALLAEAEQLHGTAHIRHHALFDALQHSEAPLDLPEQSASQVCVIQTRVCAHSACFQLGWHAHCSLVGVELVLRSVAAMLQRHARITLAHCRASASTLRGSLAL
jgi:hypothetical protein